MVSKLMHNPFPLRLSLYLHAGSGGDSVRLALVLGHQGVHVVNHIRTDGGSEHGGESDGGSHLVSRLNVENRNNRTTHLLQRTSY